MSEEKMEEGVLKNTGILDLKGITEEEIERIKAIKNVGILIVPQKFAGRITAKTENVGIIIPYVEGMRLYIGKSKLNADVLKSVEEPISIINAGKLLMEKDLTPELITQKIKEIRNHGKIVVPKLIYGALMSKVSENSGKIAVLEDEIKERIEELQREIEELRKMGE